MKFISQKLKSRRGASLILAMVFILMCLFVGGSVLAAASANGARVADQTSTQQTYLSQRSAALLMADMLEGDENSNLQLTIKRVSVKTKDPATNTVTETITVTYSLPELPTGEKYSTLQRILVENAVRKYRNGRGGGTGTIEMMDDSIRFEDVTVYQPDTAHLYTHEDYTGTFTITEPDQSTILNATFISPKPDVATKLESKHFDLRIDFGTGSQISLYVKATYSEGKPVEVTQNGITTTTTTTVIRWDDPVIEKGGFSS